MGGDDGESPIHATLGFLTQILSEAGSGCKVACLTDSELKWVFVTALKVEAVRGKPCRHHHQPITHTKKTVEHHHRGSRVPVCNVFWVPTWLLLRCQQFGFPWRFGLSGGIWPTWSVVCGVLAASCPGGLDHNFQGALVHHRGPLSTRSAPTRK